MKEVIEFEEYLNSDLKWKPACFTSEEWDNVIINNNYRDYILYWCSDGDGLQKIYRNKKKKVCEHCGSELE